MAYSQMDIMSFLTFFSGSNKAYGVTQLGTMVDGKVQVQCKAVSGRVEPSLLQKHFNGEISIGVSPMLDDSTCNFGAIDIDNYDKPWGIERIIQRIWELGIPLIPCYSKSHKLHLYIFFAQPAPAKDIRNLLKEYIALFNASPKTEIFPKQDTATSRFSSWINLPYYDESSDNCRKMIGMNMELTDLASFLYQASEYRMSLSAHIDKLHSMTYADAPMCVRAFQFIGECTTGRNNNLFNAGVYFKTKGEELRESLFAFNETLVDPLEENELEQTIISGFEKNTYTYSCKDNEFCNKIYCNKSSYNPTQTSGLTFGQLIQYETDPPSYDWTIHTNEGQEVDMHFPDAESMISQTRFRLLAMTKCHIVPYRVKDDVWADTINRAMASLVIRDSKMKDDFTHGAILWTVIRDYFNFTQVSTRPSDLVVGRLVDRGDYYIFAPSALTSYVLNTGKYDASLEDIRECVLAHGGRIKDNMWVMNKKDVQAVAKEEERTDDGF